MRGLIGTISIIIVLLFGFSYCVFAQELTNDKSVLTGTLKNGLRYIIRKNTRPENRAELRLVVNAGSILENDDQKGLAHFVEHMAFNGTEHFSKNDLVSYLESVGVKFGPELNAYTGFDETVYMLQVPTDKPEILEKGFLVLEDWAHGQVFDTAEINKERGVIGEEWRLGRGAQARMLDKQLPTLLKNSRYAERLPIGDKKVIDTFHYNSLIKFYRDWYRPNQMAVIAVGDFDVSTVEKSIEKHFASLENPKKINERTEYSIPYQKELLFVVASDKEADYTTVGFCYKAEKRHVRTENDLKNELPYMLLKSVFNDRLKELTILPEPPFTFSIFVDFGFARNMQTNVLLAYVKEDGILNGLGAIQREAERMRRYGITATELERYKSEMLRIIEKDVAEKDKTESARLTHVYVDCFLRKLPIPGIEDWKILYDKYVPLITLDEVNKAAKELFKNENRVVMVNTPEKSGIEIPDEQNLLETINRAQSGKIEAYVDNVAQGPFVPKDPQPGSIASSATNPELGLSDWRLSNGVRVIIKQTDFKNDEIRFSAFANGGSSLEDAKDIFSAKEAVHLVGASGLGDYNYSQLSKYLANKIAHVEPYIDFYTEGFNGAASPVDAETMFQLIYNYFTAPKIDSSAYKSQIAGMTSWLQNSANNPESAFNDTLTVTVTNYHPMLRPYSLSTLREIDMDKALKIYKSRFSDASGFTFIFTGNFDTTKLKPLVLKYLGGLPALYKKEKWVDLKFTNPVGLIEKTLKKGMEPKSMVAIAYNDNFDYTGYNAFVFAALIQALDIKLRDAIREDKSGTYGISIWQSIYRIPNAHYSINIQFGCNPSRADELTRAVFSIIDSVKHFGISNDDLAKVKETNRRTNEVNLRTNGYWLERITTALQNNDDLNELNQLNKWLDLLTLDDVKSAANKYFNENVVKIILLPE